MMRTVLQSIVISGLLLFAALPSHAQVVYNEGFDGAPLAAATPVSFPPYTNPVPFPGGSFTLTLPYGWTTGTIGTSLDPDNRWDRCRGTSNPSVVARTGNGMIRYLSDYTNTGESAYLATRRFDYRAWNSGALTASFYMYRDAAAGFDSIRVFIANNPDPVAATYISSPLPDAGGYTAISRLCTLSPSATANTWNQYTYSIPIASVPVSNRDSVYVIIVGYSGWGNNICIDDFSITEYPEIQTYVSGGIVYQNIYTTGVGATNQQIVGVQINMEGDGVPFTLGNVVFNTNGTTNAAGDIANARLWYSGESETFDTLSATLIGTVASPWLTNYTFNGPALQLGINNFWITYDIQSGATSGHEVDAEFVSFDLQRFKTGSGTAGTNSLTVSDTSGLVTGMSVSGTGVASGALITGFSSPTTVILNSSNTGAVSGTITFYNNYTPTVVTLPGNRIIDLTYCIPIRFQYCCYSYLNCNNDFISGVRLDGDSAATKGIYTGWQPCWPLPGNPTGHFNSNPGWYGDCGLGGMYPMAQCPFTKHPGDYDLFLPEVGTSASLKADGTTNYQIQTYIGNWYNSNYIAAFLDMNRDGNFNSNLMISTYTASPGASGAVQMIPTGNLTVGSAIVSLATLPGWAGSIAVGRSIWGPGIPGGTVITGWASPVITMSNPASATLVNSKIYIGFPGGEKIFQSGPQVRAAMVPADFCIPTTAASGTMRLRVIELYANSNIQPCASAQYGETEDYIIGALPACNSLAFGAPSGYNKIWLGYSDDWDNPYNWCGGIPTTYDNVFIPKYLGGPAPGRPGPHSPVIHNGTLASAGKLRIQSSDSLIVNSYNSGDLSIADSLIIENGSLLKVKSAYADSARFSNGVISAPTFYAPFRDGQKVRAFYVLSYADFVNEHMVAGDVIDTLIMHVQRQVTAFNNGFTNVTIKYSLVTPPVNFLPGALGSIPPYASGPWTIFSGNISADGTAAGGYTTLRIPLIPGSFVLPNTFQSYLIEICYDSNGAAGSGILQPRNTQPMIGRHTYAILYGNPAIPACSMVPNDISNPATWLVSQLRPNITFKYHRPYSEYNVEKRREWVNNGTFVPGFSKVSMTGADASGVPNTYPQNVSGTSPTTFYDLKIDNTQHVTRKTDFTVTDSLILENGYLKLDSGTVTLTNANANALKAVNGKLLSETAPAAGMYYGNFRWNMTGATLPQTYTLPFVNNAGVSVPVTYTAQTGTHDVTFATYGTGAGNTPLPQESFGYPAPVVGNINAFNVGVNNSMNMVDRYWKIYNSSLPAEADITLRYAPSEQATGGNTNMLSQRWVQNAGSVTPGPGWELPFISGQSFVPNAVTIPGFTSFGDNIWWAVVREEMPLPVELLDFTAHVVKERVQLDWTTASELNNDRFEVDRSVDLFEWKFIGKLNSQGNSIQSQYYRLYDENPVKGIQYYRLRQYDIGGRLSGYGPIAIDMTQKQFGIVSATVTTSTLGISLLFNYDSNEPYTVQVVDMMGRVIAATSDNPASPGLNVMEIKAVLASGIYQVILSNSTQVDTRKIFY
ncbi:MAG TPA: GEVED domain-containing protein [Bacteroidia bacterium]|nr:GEVED domain-containing protein [Bacteroidia bacterium]